jgi:hypothetical protein
VAAGRPGTDGRLAVSESTLQDDALAEHLEVEVRALLEETAAYGRYFSRASVGEVLPKHAWASDRRYSMS